MAGRAPSWDKPLGLLFALVLIFLATAAWGEIDGHGPDAWRVTGVASNDLLNARMGPGVDYPIIETFAANERGMQQVTCVPLLIGGTPMKLTEAERAALPPRWCLMRSADLIKAGWVAQRYITPDNMESAMDIGDELILEATTLVRRLYAAQARADRDQTDSPAFSQAASDYFSSEMVEYLKSGQVGAHPIYGAQDFDGEVLRIEPDQDNPMLRGMITVNVDYRNFGQALRAVYSLRSDTTRHDAAVRIFRIEHDGWSVPD